jgi:uncharacterized membrane protein YuzA (DUF378 family)
MKPLTTAAFILVIVGGLNWLLVGAFNFDLVAAIFGAMTTLSRAVYVLVGLSAIYLLVLTPKLLGRVSVTRSSTAVR